MTDPSRFRPKNVEDVGWQLHSTLWGSSRHNPAFAKDIWSRMLGMSLSLPLSRDARKRLQWFYDCAVKFKGNVQKTCRYHGIPRKTFYYWRKQFNVRNPRSLETRSRRPKIGRLPVLRPEQTKRIFELRSTYPYYSKMKIAVLYEKKYGETVSSWQVQRVIERFQLYPNVVAARKIAWRRKHAKRKQRIASCGKNAWTGWLFSIDTITLHMVNEKRYILTAIDRHSRLLFTRAYKNHSSRSAADFLEQLFDFAGNKIQNIHTDNGSEFHDAFEKAAKRMGLQHYWSRTHTPKDNAMNERVNRTIQEEFLPAYRYCSDLGMFNDGLVSWMYSYNHERPHTALGYKTPFEVAYDALNPMPRLESSFADYDHAKGRLMTEGEWEAFNEALDRAEAASKVPQVPS